MNDQTNSQTLPLDPPFKADAELDGGVDRGEKSPVIPKTETDLHVEKSKEIEANFTASTNVVNLMVELKIVSQDPAQSIRGKQRTVVSQDNPLSILSVKQELSNQRMKLMR